MHWTLELTVLPVTDVDQAKALRQSDWVHRRSRPHGIERGAIRAAHAPSSGCSIAFGKGLTDAEPGSGQGIFLFVDDIQAAREHLLGHGVEVGPVDVQPWGHFFYFADPEGNAGRCSICPIAINCKLPLEPPLLIRRD